MNLRSLLLDEKSIAGYAYSLGMAIAFSAQWWGPFA
jgi:hypothetical protein